MTDKEEKLKELIRNNPKLSGNKIYIKSQQKKISIRKTDFYKLLRTERNLPEPSKEKKEKSIPKKYVVPIKPVKKVVPIVADKPIKKVEIPKIPFEKTNFGKMVKAYQKKAGISEKRAIERARLIKKIPKRDYNKLKGIDKTIAFQYKT